MIHVYFIIQQSVKVIKVGQRKIFIYLQEMYIFMQQGLIKMIKSDLKYI